MGDERLLNEMTEYLQRQEAATRPNQWVNERPIEYAFVLSELNRLSCHTVLDVGTGRTAFPAVLRQCGFQVTASDSKGSYWSDFHNHHIWVHTNDITVPVLDGPFNAVAAVSCIEHISEADAAVEGMVKLASPGGVVILTFPYSHSMYVDDVYTLPQADTYTKSIPYITQIFSESNIEWWKTHLGLTELRRVYFRAWAGEFWRTGERLAFPQEVESPADANGLCISMCKAKEETNE